MGWANQLILSVLRDGRRETRKGNLWLKVILTGQSQDNLLHITENGKTRIPVCKRWTFSSIMMKMKKRQRKLKDSKYKVYWCEWYHTVDWYSKVFWRAHMFWKMRKLDQVPRKFYYCKYCFLERTTTFVVNNNNC